MSRAFILVLDSLGVGGAPDAARYGDVGADTVGHIALRCAEGDADQAGLRHGALRVPTLASLGLGQACRLATGDTPPGLDLSQWNRGRAGCAEERSLGNDSQSGHWEIAGCPVEFEWGYFHDGFPDWLVQALCERGGLPGVLGLKHAPGAAIVQELGALHLRTGKPIVYTSSDSVFQIAAHEEAFGLDRLYALCRLARELVDPLRVGRVIARPFTGTPASGFTRTRNRKDFGVTPPDGTLLRRAVADRREVVSVGKIGDLFCHDATGREYKTGDNDEVWDRTLEAARSVADGGLVFSNFVDFDTLYGHRRDVAGYAAALEAFDQRLAGFMAGLREGDLAIVTGDHGCDPTWRGSDHTRECVPVLAFGPAASHGTLGRRESFADMAATVATHLKLPRGYGAPFAV